MRQAARSLFATAAAAAAARLGLRAARDRASAQAGTAGPLAQERWNRTNHRGEPVTLLEGPVCAAAAAAGVLAAPGLPGRMRAAGVAAALGAGAFGVYDDLCGNADRRGIRGHLTALAHGEVTTGGVKIVGIGAVGVLGGCLVRRDGAAVDKALAAVLIAGAANAVNLLDLRPGRAVKGAALAALPGVLRRAVGGGAAGGTGTAGDAASGAGARARSGRAAGSAGAANVLALAGLGAAAALLPEDLGERAMLGDAGANALGALLGTAAAAGARSRAALAWRAAVMTGVTLASEKVSFTKVIAASPPLNAVDLWGRRPPPAARVPAQSAAAAESPPPDGDAPAVDPGSVDPGSVDPGSVDPGSDPRTVDPSPDGPSATGPDVRG